MPQLEELHTWRGRDPMDRDGDEIGTIADVYLDAQTGRPEWLAVTTGLSGMRASFVPTAETSASGDGVRVPFERAWVTDEVRKERIEADGDIRDHDRS
jgi:sporulation protein YlmC with PRC-barrel domain